jgi:hypothetical protein
VAAASEPRSLGAAKVGNTVHYLPNKLNQYDMFQRLGGLARSPDAPEALRLKIDHFLYRASCVLVGLERMYAAESASVLLARNYLGQIKLGADRRIALSTETLFELYAQVPAALAQLVALQNATLLILQGAFQIQGSVPSSFHKAMTKGLETFGFSQATAGLASAYWEGGGRRIRDLRDVNEHHLALVDHTYFRHIRDPGEILVLLPDNPEVKQPKSFTYDSESDAYEAISEGIKSLDAFLDGALKLAGIKPRALEASLHLEHLGDLIPPQERTLGLLISVTKEEIEVASHRRVLDTVEIQQVIPEQDGAGNLAMRKLKTDSEVESSGGGA